MLLSTAEFDLFEILRVPYRQSPPSGDRTPVASLESAVGRFHSIRQEGDDSASGVWWPAFDGSATAPRARLYWLGDVPFYAALIPAAVLDPRGEAGGWVRMQDVLDDRGERVASLWRCADGNVILPFDPNQAIRNFLAERYADDAAAGFLRRTGVQAYYRLRPLIPRRVQIGLRRRFSAIQSRARFPRWPQEPGLHDLFRAMYILVGTTTGTELPWIAPWPSGREWAIVLTHDVESETGYRNIDRLREIEASMGFRSSWNFVPRRYNVSDELVAELVGDGFEVGVHGLYHDGRDLESDAMLAERLPEMRAWATQWGARGFRSPATHRRWEWMGRLGFDYDSSYADTDPYEPQPGGCGSLWPFFIDETVELPITMSQDHTLFVILGQTTIEAWSDKARYIRGRNGMALMLTHPDYLATNELAGRYSEMLTEVADDETAWRALPGEVSDWWRRRAASRIEGEQGGWRIEGQAAADGVVTTIPPR